MAEAKRYNLAEFVEAKRAEDSIVVELPDGTEITIPPGYLWPEDAFTAMFTTGDMGAATRAFLGDEQYERLLANGYTWQIVDRILRDAQGASVGESSASVTT